MYGQYDYKNSKLFNLSFGLRSTYFNELDAVRLEPRLVIYKPLTKNLKFQGSAEIKNQIISEIDETILSDLSLENRLWRLADGNAFPIIKSRQVSVGFIYMNKGLSIDIDAYHKKLNNITGWMVFAIATFVYLSTMEQTTSLWDCGEFIAVSHTLGVPHPPGSPFFLLLGRIFSMLPFNEDIAFRVNIISPLVSALAVMLLYLSIVKVVTHWRVKVNCLSDCLIVFGGGAAGALAFAFTDSHWFNAVEAEVYAFSTFFTAIVVWLILLWNEKADQKGHERYLLIIAYMIGLATGLHLLNLLAIPFITLIIYFRKYKVEWKSFGINVLITAIIFFVIHNGIIKGLPKMAAGFLGVWGTAFLIISVFGLMIWAVLNKQHIISIATTSIVLVLIGYSTYTMIFIRSNQDPVIDENDPETVEAMISYLEREQYGSVGQFPRRFKGLKQMYEVVGPPSSNGEYSSRQKSQYRKTDIDKQWDFFWNYQIKKM